MTNSPVCKNKRKKGTASCPVKTSPELVKCITDGIVLVVSTLFIVGIGTISVFPESVTIATALFVVPKSMPQMPDEFELVLVLVTTRS